MLFKLINESFAHVSMTVGNMAGNFVFSTLYNRHTFFTLKSISFENFFKSSICQRNMIFAKFTLILLWYVFARLRINSGFQPALRVLINNQLVTHCQAVRTATSAPSENCWKGNCWFINVAVFELATYCPNFYFFFQVKLIISSIWNYK